MYVAAVLSQETPNVFASSKERGSKQGRGWQTEGLLILGSRWDPGILESVPYYGYIIQVKNRVEAPLSPSVFVSIYLLIKGGSLISVSAPCPRLEHLCLGPSRLQQVGPTSKSMGVCLTTLTPHWTFCC